MDENGTGDKESDLDWNTEDGKASGCSTMGGVDAAGLALLGLLSVVRRRRED